MPLIVRVNGAGEVSVLSLDNIPHASVNLTDAPASRIPPPGRIRA